MAAEISPDAPGIDLAPLAEDAFKVQNTDKATTEEDGEQPGEPMLWNDDSGEVILESEG